MSMAARASMWARLWEWKSLGWTPSRTSIYIAQPCAGLTLTATNHAYQSVSSNSFIYYPLTAERVLQQRSATEVMRKWSAKFIQLHPHSMRKVRRCQIGSKRANSCRSSCQPVHTGSQ